MDGRLVQARAAATAAVPSSLVALESWLRIPSISGDRAHRPHVGDAAAWLAGRLRRISRRVRVIDGLHGPVVAATIASAPGKHPGTVVLYGHLDVKQPGPGWSSPPFEPTRRAGRLVARGASDDKGPVMALLVALGAWVSLGGPPTDVLLIVDGAEEIGSPGLARALDILREAFPIARPVLAVVVVDTRLARPGVPSMTVAQRGTLAMRVQVSTGSPPVHAGRFGGVVTDPSLVLARGLVRASVAVAGMAPRSWPATRRASLSVTQLSAGAGGEAIPATASAALDVRIPPGADPERALGEIKRTLRADDVGRVTTDVTVLASNRGPVLVPSRAAALAVCRASRAAFGVHPQAVISGGSIAAVPTLAAAFARTPILVGMAPVDDGAHGPDEHLDVADWTRGVDLCVCLLAMLADSHKPSISCRTIP